MMSADSQRNLSMPSRVLDLYCCAGGAAMGLHRAWPSANITGVDIVPQKNYPFTFALADALEYPLADFDFIWASPPCQHYSTAAISHRKNGREYKDLIAATRAKLNASGIPWVIENVISAPIRKDIVLCGSHFGLKVVRHRAFELWNGQTVAMPPCHHADDVVTVCGHGTPAWVMKQRRERGYKENPPIAEKRNAMGIHWTNRNELSQAIPPAYSQFIANLITVRP